MTNEEIFQMKDDVNAEIENIKVKLRDLPNDDVLSPTILVIANQLAMIGTTLIEIARRLPEPKPVPEEWVEDKHPDDPT